MNEAKIWPENWDCEAYGEAGRELGAVCFFMSQWCMSAAECHARMVAARKELFQRIQTAAAAGHPLGVHLAAEFSSPDELLAGSEHETEAVAQAVFEGVLPPRPVFTCPRCKQRSPHPRDIAEGYCPRCHDWTGAGAGLDGAPDG